MKFSALPLLLTLMVFACKQSSPSSSTGDVISNSSDSAGSKISVRTLYSGLSNPWGMVWLPDGRLLITERRGEILVFRNDRFTGEKISGVPAVFARGQGGLLDIQKHPDYQKNGWLYLVYSKPVKGGAATTLMRAKLKDNQLVEKQDIFQARPAVSADYHFGSRIAFDNEGYLYVVAGERGTREKVQDLGNDLGKIHRLHDDGRVPADNPFVNRPGARPSIWTYGHRNPQGMVFDKENNRLWAVEHGPKGGDELNLIEKGKNYGWPLVTYGINYDGSPISDKKEMAGVQKPVKYWVPSRRPAEWPL